ncbi:MAG: molybdopterin converting factor subunit 1 [Methanomassiliicoccales archaeon]
MRARVLLFAHLAERAGTRELFIETGEGTTVGELIQKLVVKYPQLEKEMAHISLAVNEEIVAPSFRLSDGDTVALLPPVSGGA